MSLSFLRNRGRMAAALLSAATLCVTVPAFAADTASAADQAFEQKVLEIIRQHPREIMEAVVTYQRAEAERRQQTLETRLKQELASMPPAELLGNSPARGAAARRLVLVEFSDFQCPYCGRAFATVQSFMQAHENEVTLVYKHLPLVDLHPEAANAALAAWAAEQQGKFWEYHDALFGAQDQLGEKYYIATAARLGLDLERFNQDRHGDPARLAINQDLALAHKLGIDSTPLFVLNSIPITGAAPLAEFEKALATARAARP